MAEQRPKVRLDEFVSKVVPDPKSAGEALLVSGFLGRSSEDGYTRVYWDASLNSYVDVKDTDILHSEPLPKESSPLGGYFLWVKNSAEVYFGAGGRSTKGRFFEGPLMSAYGGQFPGSGGTPTAAPYFTTPVCPISQVCTPTAYLPCVSGYCTRSLVECTALCVTRNFIGCTYVCTHVVCVASPACPPVGPGTPVQGQVGVQAAFRQFPNTEFCTVPTMKACTHQAWCYSQGCYPTYEWGCPYGGGWADQARVMNAALPQPGNLPSLVCSYAQGCWFSWDACPTLFGYGCGGGGGSRHFCPQV